MKLSSSIVSKMNFRKRNANSYFEKFSPSSTTDKLKTKLSLQNSQKFTKNYQNKSPNQKRYKSIGFNSTRNSNNSCRYKLLSPKNKINKKNSSTQNDQIIIDNNSIYNSIITKIENIMLNYQQEAIKLYYILSNVDNFINSIQDDELIFKHIQAKNNFHKSFSSNENENIFKNNSDNFEENKLNSRINNTNKINISNNNNQLEIEQSESDVCIYKRKINRLIIKINEMEKNFKIEQLKYLFCIGEYHKRVNELEKKLNLNTIDQMPKDELKKLLCYPHYVKFDVNEDINPKSVPMFIKRKNKCQSSIYDNRANKKIGLSKSASTINTFDLILKKYKENNNNTFNLDNDKNNNENVEFNNDLEELDNDNKVINFEEVKNTIELGKNKFESKTKNMDIFFGKNKSFFLSHPKLNYIKSLNEGSKISSWKLENQINSLPKQLSKLKMQSKSQKNAIVVFPSFLSETMVNLEKLRTNKNFRSIENKFEETYKMKLKN